MSSTPEGGLVVSVTPGSVGDEIGLEQGDRLVSINGHTLRDIIDYRYHSTEEELTLVVERAGERHTLKVERDYDEDLGLEFAEPVFDGIRLCDNRCPFCFVRQMPRGMRRTLYVRDDDYRYSFLLGNFCTLTNLSDEDWRRIDEQRLSPLYVSIHATDPDVRRQVLGNPDAPDIRDQLSRLRDLRIEVHGQIVLSPGVNDGAVLRQSVEELLGYWPSVRTLALVPVGLTRYHRKDVRAMTPTEAVQVLELADSLDAHLRHTTGRTWLYPSDELFLLAGRSVPPRLFYDDEDAQRENGVGLVREFLDDWARVRVRYSARGSGLRHATLVCGTLIAPILEQMAAEASQLGIRLDCVPVTNQLLGESVTVSGLLAGEDVMGVLRGRQLGQRVFLPRAMFDAEGIVTLDDLTSDEITSRLGAPVELVHNMSEVLDSVHRG